MQCARAPRCILYWILQIQGVPPPVVLSENNEHYDQLKKPFESSKRKYICISTDSQPFILVLLSSRPGSQPAELPTSEVTSYLYAYHYYMLYIVHPFQNINIRNDHVYLLLNLVDVLQEK